MSDVNCNTSNYSESKHAFIVYDNKRASLFLYGISSLSIILSLIAYQYGILGTVDIPLNEFLKIYLLSLFTDPFFILVVVGGAIYKVVKNGFHFNEIETVKESTHRKVVGIIFIGLIVAFSFAFINNELLSLWLLILTPSCVILIATFITPYIFRLDDTEVTNLIRFDRNVLIVAAVFTIAIGILMLILIYRK